MKRKQMLWSTCLMILILSLAVSACGKNDLEADSDQDKPAEQTELQYEGESLLVYSGAGLSKAMDAVAAAFEEKYGANLQMNYAGCAQLLGQMEVNKTGDVFVGGSLNDADIALKKGFTDDTVNLVYHIPAIAVPKGNPAGIKTLADMAKPGVKLVLGDAESNAIGKKGEKIFEKNGLTEAIHANVTARDATVNEIVTHIGLKQGDAGLVWEDNGVGASDIEIITIPEEQNVIDQVPVCVLNFSEKKELAQLLVDFMCSDEGKAIFIEYGFKPL
ncbi:MAG TPA: molybdate ABC transporter substrate-binding protein [Clostridiales bacterium]|nr:molybdate ABC transporter substrate-binding protein [Clostridiales bacterium]